MSKFEATLKEQGSIIRQRSKKSIASRRYGDLKLTQKEEADLKYRRAISTSVPELDLCVEYTESQYIDLCKSNPGLKIEYRYGEIIIEAMSENPSHSKIKVGLISLFDNYWGPGGSVRDCTIYSGNSVAYENPELGFSNNKFYRIPDIFRVCGTPKERSVVTDKGNKELSITNPDILLEITSESSFKDDTEYLGGKVEDYRRFPSFKYYIVIDWYKSKNIYVYGKTGRRKTYKASTKFSLDGTTFDVNKIMKRG